MDENKTENKVKISVDTILMTLVVIALILYIVALVETNKITEHEYFPVKSSVSKPLIACIVFTVLIITISSLSLYFYYTNKSYNYIFISNAIVELFYVSLLILTVITVAQIPSSLRLKGPFVKIYHILVVPIAIIGLLTMITLGYIFS